MLAFLVIALSLYGLINFYIGRRGAQALAAYPTARTVFLAFFIAMVLAYPLGRVLMGLAKGFPTAPLIKAGSFHMVVMLYGFLGVVLVDLARLANAFFSFLPKSFTERPGAAGLVLFVVIAGSTAAAIIGGAINAARPRTVELAWSIPKKAGPLDHVTVVLVSDLHLGSLVGRGRLEKTVARINALEPDIVLMPGDIVDESVTEKIEAGFSEVMRRIRAPLGVFAVPGNHEFYSGLDRNLACLRACGITVLEDQAVRVGAAFTLVGRKDRSSLKPGETRLAIPGILTAAGLDASLPIVVIDHQPLHLEEAAAAGAALQLSGHTHDGQVFPFDVINGLIYELNWGHLRKGGTHYYVTSGAGTWGPPIRVGSRAEVVRIRLSFSDN